MARRYNQLRSREKLSNEVEIRIIEQKIKKIERYEENGEQFLKIVTENGNRCKLSSYDDDFRYNYGRWKIVFECLQEGDTIELYTARGRILRTKLNIIEGGCCLKDLKIISNDEAVLTIVDEGVPERIETIKSDSCFILDGQTKLRAHFDLLLSRRYVTYIYIYRVSERLIGIVV